MVSRYACVRMHKISVDMFIQGDPNSRVQCSKRALHIVYSYMKELPWTGVRDNPSLIITEAFYLPKGKNYNTEILFS